MSAELVNAALNALPETGRCMRTAELAEKMGGVAPNFVSATMVKLIRRRLVERVRPGCFRLTRTGIEARDSGRRLTSGPAGPHTGIRKPRPGTLRARLWKALRQEKKAGAGELIVLARSDDDGDRTENALRYLAALAATPLVQRMRRRGSHEEFRYFLREDPGPKAPVLRASRGEVFDPNTGAVYDIGRGGREARS